MRCPGELDDVRGPLWSIHSALVHLRAAAWKAPSAALLGSLRAFADALDALVSSGPGVYLDAVQRLVQPSVGLSIVQRQVPSGPTRLVPTEASALAQAMAVSVRELALRAEQEPALDLAKALDEMEYVPCEALRLGSSFVAGLDAPGAPPHVLALARVFAQRTGPFSAPCR